jgi:hypothetical protein
MRPGSKGWILMMRKIYWTHEALLLFVLTLKFYYSEKFTLQLWNESTFVNVLFYYACGVVVLFQLLAIFDREFDQPNWKIVYPELRENYKYKHVKLDINQIKSKIKNRKSRAFRIDQLKLKRSN